MSHFIFYISNFSFSILYFLLPIFYFLFLIFHFSFFICVILGSVTQGDFRDVLQEQLRAGLGARDLDDLESGYRDPEDPRKVSISYLLTFIIVFLRIIFYLHFSSFLYFSVSRSNKEILKLFLCFVGLFFTNFCQSI